MNALAVWMLLAVATIDDATPTSAPIVAAAVEGTVEPAAVAPPTTAPATTPPPPATPPVTVRALPSSWAPPTTGDASGLFVAAQIFTGFEAPISPVQQTTWPRFVVDRVEFGGGVVHQRLLQAVVRLEAIRSASAQSAFGIDVNSLLPRFRLAYGAVTPTTSLLGVDVDLVLRAGLIPEPWLERLEARSAVRGLVPLPSERAGVIFTSDLGASVSSSFNHGLLDVVVAMTNGEGKNEEERNAGKNLEFIASTTPLRLPILDDELSFNVAAGWRDGSLGISSARAHRGLLAVTASHPWLHVGAEAVWALGVDERAERERLVLGAWADAQPIPGWLGLVLRYDLGAELNTDVDDARVHTILGGAFCDFGHTEVAGRQAGVLLRRVRLYATAETKRPEAGAAVAGATDATEATRLLLTLEVNGVSDVVDLFTRHTQGPTP